MTCLEQQVVGFGSQHKLVTIIQMRVYQKTNLGKICIVLVTLVSFYTRINLCGQAANESLALGELGNLGNPPIAQIDTTTGESNSKLNPGIFPWGHCITYACGNPEYSPNYDSGTTSNGNPQITFNKLGERGCEAQTPWAQMPLNYYYSNVTFAGIKVWFFDETTRSMTSKNV